MGTFDPTFNCNGKVNRHDWHLNDSSFFRKRDLDFILNNNNLPSSNNIFKIFNYDTSGISILLNLQHFNKCLESKLKQFERHEKLKASNETTDSYMTTDFYLLRKSACEFVYHLRNYLKCLKAENFALKDINNDIENDFNDLISTIIKFLSRLKNIPASTFLYVSSTAGNSSKQPEYHTYHFHLDLRWLLTTLLCIKSDQWQYSNEMNEDLKNCIYNTVQDMVYVCMRIFETTPFADLPTKTPYSCTCMRELWLMLQILTDDLSKKNLTKPFWDYVNSVLNHLFFNGSMANIPGIQKYGVFPGLKSHVLFCIWLMYHLTLLYGYDTDGNYLSKPSNRYQEIQMTSCKTQLEKMLKSYINNGVKQGTRDETDDELCIMIPILHVLFIDWGQADFQLLALLWDCFHKRLDKPFLIQVRGPWVQSAEKKTPMDILNSVKNRLKSNYETSQESSYGLFLHLLGIFLKNNYSRTETKIWFQIKGRIFMKITEKKLLESTECGLYNFISLCLTLAITADTSDVAAFMTQVFPDVGELKDTETAKKFSLIWKTQLVMLLLYDEKKMPLKEIAEYYKGVANKICCLQDEHYRSMMLWFIDVIRIILTTHNNNFENYEHALLDGWIERSYIETASNRIGLLTNTLLKAFQKCIENRNVAGNNLVKNAIIQHAGGRVRVLVNNNDFSTNFYEAPTKFGVLLTIEACYDSHKMKSLGHSAAKLFLHYTTSPILRDLRVAKLYLNLILQNETAVQHLRKEKEIKDFDLLCIQLWIKTTILTKEDDDQYVFFKNYFANLPTIREIMSIEKDYNEFLQSAEPLAIFLATAAKKRNTFKTEQEQMAYDNKCRSFLFNIERWILSLINDGNKDSKLSNWIYHCISLIIKHWSQILYSRNSPNLLKTLISKAALPLDQQTLVYRSHLSQKIFPTIILSFENLNINTDISLQNLIRELFEKYLPLLVTPNERSYKVAATLTRCFSAKPDFTKTIFFILAKNLITIPGEQTTHAVCHLVMYLLISLVKAGKSYSIEILDSIISECTESIVNCYVRVPDSHSHKRLTMDFLREVTTNPYYRESVSLRGKLKDAIWNVLKKSTISQSHTSFSLLSSTSNISKELFKHLLANMETFVCECEKKQISRAPTLRFLLNSAVKKT